MPTTKKSGKKKAAYQKSKAMETPKKKGSKSGGGKGGFDSGDPIIITGGGSVKLKFNGNKFKGTGGNRRDPAADLDSVVIDDPLNPPSVTIPVSPNTVITINFK